MVDSLAGYHRNGDLTNLMTSLENASTHRGYSAEQSGQRFDVREL